MHFSPHVHQISKSEFLCNVFDLSMRKFLLISAIYKYESLQLSLTHPPSLSFVPLSRKKRYPASTESCEFDVVMLYSIRHLLLLLKQNTVYLALPKSRFSLITWLESILFDSVKMNRLREIRLLGYSLLNLQLITYKSCFLK